MLSDPTYIYALSLGSVFGFLLLINSLPCFRVVLAFVHRLTLQYLVFLQLFRRNRYLEPWSLADALVQICYVAANALCVGFGAASLSEAGVRAAHLSLINMAPAFAGPHLSFLADVLGVSLGTFRRIHRSAGAVSVQLLAFHVATVVAAKTPFPLQVAQNMWALVGASSLCLLLVLSLPVLRRLSYEAFLRMHQALAILAAFSIWRHSWPLSFFPRLMAYIVSSTFVSMLVLQSLHFFYQNKAKGADLCRAYIARTDDVVKIRLTLSRSIRVEPGQYVGLWIPAAGFCSFLQTHPFTVVSWSEGKQKHLDLLVKPRKGITRKLLGLAKTDNEQRFRGEKVGEYIYTRNLQPHLAFISGPHGLSVPVCDYKTVVMIASGFGIASHLPYLRQLYQSYKTRNRRIHLVWEAGTEDEVVATMPLLNSALIEDALDNGYALSISIYASGKSWIESLGKRVNIYRDATPNIAAILEEERAGIHMDGVQEESEKREDMAVLVSATSMILDETRKLMRLYTQKGVKLYELEYQPA